MLPTTSLGNPLGNPVKFLGRLKTISPIIWSMVSLPHASKRLLILELSKSPLIMM